MLFHYLHVSVIKLVKIFLIVINVFVLFLVCIYLWTVSWCWGCGCILGIVGFFIGYRISPKIVIARRDYWRLPEYTIFKRRLAYGNSIAGTITVVTSFVIMGIAMLCGISV